MRQVFSEFSRIQFGRATQRNVSPSRSLSGAHSRVSRSQELPERPAYRVSRGCPAAARHSGEDRCPKNLRRALSVGDAPTLHALDHEFRLVVLARSGRSHPSRDRKMLPCRLMDWCFAIYEQDRVFTLRCGAHCGLEIVVGSVATATCLDGRHVANESRPLQKLSKTFTAFDVQ